MHRRARKDECAPRRELPQGRPEKLRLPYDPLSLPAEEISKMEFVHGLRNEVEFLRFGAQAKESTHDQSLHSGSGAARSPDRTASAENDHSHIPRGTGRDTQYISVAENIAEIRRRPDLT